MKKKKKGVAGSDFGPSNSSLPPTCGDMSRSRVMDLDIVMEDLAVEMERLWLLNNTVRSELRRNGGHKGKASEKVLVWLEHAVRLEKQFRKIGLQYLSLIKMVKFTRFNSYSVLVMFSSSRPFRGLRPLQCFLVGMLMEQILEYLADPLIRSISFYGGGWLKHKITRQIKTGSRVEWFHKSSIKTLRRNIQKHEDAEVNKCLVMSDYDCIVKPRLFNKVKRPIRYLYLGYKIKNQILKLTDEVKVLAKSYKSLQLLYVEDAADRVLGKFTTRKRLTSGSAQRVTVKMWEYLLDPMIARIGLFGEAGVGKTTIIKNICNELSNTGIFDMIIWVSVSRTKLANDNYMRLQDAIAKQLGIKLPGSEKLEKRASRISEKIKTLGKCLFILDDVWEIVYLSPMGIPFPKSANGCKLVFTTRHNDILADTFIHLQVQRKIHLAPLRIQEAWDLFVSNSGDQVLQPEIKNIAKEMVYECRGLPITILTVSHAMKYTVNITAWRLALKDLQSSHSRREGMDHLFDVLKFGYNRLMNDQVRACFLCCAIFPEDYKIDSTELIRYWMAEGFINNEGGIVESIKDGLEIVEVLKDANMLEIFMEGGTEWLIMHDMFRDLAITIMREELDFIVKAGIGERKFSSAGNEKLSLIRNRIVQLETLHNSCKTLSTLLLRDNPLYYISYSFFFSMPNLQVLDMSYSGLRQLPPSLLELSKLRVLFLDFCTGLKNLPSLEKLNDLQFLSLRGTLIEELPQGIEGLVNLRSLDLSETIRLEHIKADVLSSLLNLEELQLQGSRLCKMGSQEVANLFKEISCLKQLSILTLSSIGFGDHLDTILHLQQYNLKIFSVNAYGSTLDYIEDE